MLLGPCSFWVLAFYYHLSISYNHCGDGGETAILCYILTAGQHSFQQFAISLRAPFNMDGSYQWFYPNGSSGRQGGIQSKTKNVVETAESVSSKPIVSL